MRDCSQQLETELAALTAERDLFRAEATWWKNLHKKSEDDEISVEVKANIDQLRAAELAAERALYQELLLQVGSKCDGETLHQTALRRLRSASIDAAMKEDTK
jgi:CO dehydrogenase/acetyl-CoA synthase gamma subunit (corrinoid Fe-S protein)